MLIETKDCPFCGQGGNTPCFAVYTDGYKCFSCGKCKINDYSLTKASQQTIDKSLPNLPKVNKNPSSFTIDGQKWLLQYFITTDIAKHYNIWETERNSFIFPVLDGDNVIFYVERYYNEKKIFNRGQKQEMLIRCSQTANTVVIVEDFISAVRVHNAGFNVLCLFGTKIKYGRLKQMISDFNKIILWLDGDEAGQKSTGVLYSMIQSINKKRRVLESPKCVYSIQTDLDPKKYTKEEIMNEIHSIV
jgi:DNA primase